MSINYRRWDKVERVIDPTATWIFSGTTDVLALPLRTAVDGDYINEIASKRVASLTGQLLWLSTRAFTLEFRHSDRG